MIDATGKLKPKLVFNSPACGAVLFEQNMLLVQTVTWREVSMNFAEGTLPLKRRHLDNIEKVPQQLFERH